MVKNRWVLTFAQVRDTFVNEGALFLPFQMRAERGTVGTSPPAQRLKGEPREETHQ